MTCQRCNESLREEDRYCPVCGLPQLTYVPPEAPVVEMAGSDAGQISADLSGNLASMGGIAWRPAMKTALIVAIPAAVLCFTMWPIGLIWMLGAAAWAVAIYAKRARAAWLSTGIGARIGLMTGMFASWLTISLYGMDLWISRFVLHQGEKWDSLWLSQVSKSLDNNQEMMAQMGSAGAQSAQAIVWWRAELLSPEGRAGVPLSGLVIMAFFLIILAIIGGAVSGRLLAQSRRSAV